MRSRKAPPCDGAQGAAVERAYTSDIVSFLLFKLSTPRGLETFPRTVRIEGAGAPGNQTQADLG
eukprot:4659936-Pyramimonas_sp.AAC.1